MKRLLSVAAAVLALLLAASASAATVPPDAVELTGHYYLNGRGEIGSELLLKPDGTFQWAMMYGAVDLSAHGTWTLKDGKVTLTSAAQGKPEFKLFKDSDYGRTKPAEPGVWVAIVGFPYEGPLPNVEVQFESASGKTVTAVSKRNGDALANMPASEQWKRAGLRMKDSGAPYQWIDLPPARAQARLAGFTVVNREAVTPSAFTTMTLKVDGGALRADQDGFSGTYEKAK
jgi:hypothetical protein